MRWLKAPTVEAMDSFNQSADRLDKKVAELSRAAREGDVLSALPASVDECNALWRECCPAPLRPAYDQMLADWEKAYKSHLGSTSLANRLSCNPRQQEIVEKTAMGIMTALAFKVFSQDENYAPTPTRQGELGSLSENLATSVCLSLAGYRPGKVCEETSFKEAKGIYGALIGRSTYILRENPNKYKALDLSGFQLLMQFYGTGQRGIERADSMIGS